MKMTMKKMEKKTTKMEEKQSTEIDAELDQSYQHATDSLILDVLIWKTTAEEETKDENDIVTITSDSESDGEGRTRRTRCRCNKLHKSKKQLMACLGREDNDKDYSFWKDFITELGKAVTRDNVTKKKLAIAFRVGAQQLGERKPQNYLSLQGEALRPEAQECHKGNLYKEALQQAKKSGPPLYTFIFNTEIDSWVKYLTSYQDVINSITNQIDKTAEREAMKAKIRIIKSLTKAFEETTAREETARKGYNRGRNMSSFDAGEKVGRMALKTMNKWQSERNQYEALCQTRKTLGKEKREENPGPNTKCSFCKKIPDSRLKRCGKCKFAFYCTTECQRRAWRHHRIECRLDSHPTKANWPV